MTKNKEWIFVDTSGFKALIDDNDEFHNKAVTIWQNLSQKGVFLLTSNYILDETFTLLRSKRGINLVLQFRDYLVKSAPVLRIERVLSRDEADAWGWFTKEWSKLSFTNSVSFSLMKRLGIKQVFGFDKHFKQAGFDMNLSNEETTKAMMISGVSKSVKEGLRQAKKGRGIPLSKLK